MPFSFEHSARLKNSDNYERFRRENDKGGKGVHFIYGFKREGGSEIQSIRFSIDYFTADEARKWLKGHDHKAILFEVATRKSKPDSQIDMKRENIIQKILKKIVSGVADSNSIFREELIDISVNTKFEYINNGDVMLIHDVPIAKEMVQKYDDGMHYKTAEAIDKINVEFSPLSLSHPDIYFNQMSDSERLSRIIGYTSNGYTQDSRKFADFFLFVDKVPGETIKRIENKQQVDVSIGFNLDIDETPGEFKGQKYDKSQTSIKLDHTAILKSNEQGRASLPDGVGIGADKNNEVINLEDQAAKILKDKLDKLEGEVKDSQKTIQDKDAEITKLTDEKKTLKADMEEKKVTELKDKATKYDKIVKDQKAADEKKVIELKDKILTHKKARTDDNFKKHIEKKTDVAELQFILDDMNGSIKKIPSVKGKGADKGKHPADVAFQERYEKQTGTKLGGVC